MTIRSKYFSNQNYGQLYALSALSVFLGGIIYLLLRPVKASFFKLINHSGIEELADKTRQFTVPAGEFFPDWFVYTLPNGLWAFGYTILIVAIWNGSKSLFKYFWYATIPILIFGFELLQRTGNILGTFAFDDIISGFVGIAMGILITKLYAYEKIKV